MVKKLKTHLVWFPLMWMRTLKVREKKKHSSYPYNSVLQDTPLPEGHDWTATLPRGPTLPLDCGLLEGRVQSNSLCPQWPTQVLAQSLYSPNVCWMCEDGAETFSGSNQRHVFNTAFQSAGVWDEPHTWGDCHSRWTIREWPAKNTWWVGQHILSNIDPQVSSLRGTLCSF